MSPRNRKTKIMIFRYLKPKLHDIGFKENKVYDKIGYAKRERSAQPLLR